MQLELDIDFCNGFFYTLAGEKSLNSVCRKNGRFSGTCNETKSILHNAPVDFSTASGENLGADGANSRQDQGVSAVPTRAPVSPWRQAHGPTRVLYRRPREGMDIDLAQRGEEYVAEAPCGDPDGRGRTTARPAPERAGRVAHQHGQSHPQQHCLHWTSLLWKIPAHYRQDNPDKKTRWRAVPRAEWTEVPVPPIVDQALFDAAQAQLARKAWTSRRNCKYGYLMVGGRLRCGQCGRSLSGYLDVYGHGRYRCTLQPYQDEGQTHTKRSIPARSTASGARAGDCSP